MSSFAMIGSSIKSHCFQMEMGAAYYELNKAADEHRII